MTVLNSSLYCQAIQIGGAVNIQVQTVATSGCMISRSETGSGGTFTTIYSGQAIDLFIDCGDMLPGPLSSGTTYIYKLVDDLGITFSNSIVPACTLNLQQEPLLIMLFKLLQAGLSNLTPPQGVTKILGNQVIMAMPLTGLPQLPLVTLNLDLIQQTLVPIGQQVEQVDNTTGTWVIPGFVERVFRMSVLASSTVDRDFYRDALLGICQTILQLVFAPLGLDVHHKIQATSGQVAKDPDGNAPGFYYSDSLLSCEGTFNLSITPNYGIIQNLDVMALSAGTVTETIVP